MQQHSFPGYQFCAFLLLLTLPVKTLLQPAASSQPARQASITVQLDPAHPANTLIAPQALGAGIDGHEQGEIARLLTPQNIKEMLSAGLKPLTYRLRTELSGECWHWNPKGNWSDAKHRQGYWISATTSSKPIAVGYGYRLPRRGNTIDQANNDGYSRLADGDTRTFWKSNPYLDPYFTGEANSAHPQWVMIDLGETEPVNAIRILWGKPFATHYRVEYGVGEDAEPTGGFIPATANGVWRVFPNGEVTNLNGGTSFIQLSDQPIATRFLRLWLTTGSGVAISGSKDIRDRLGYALCEVSAGLLSPSGRFQDFVRHAKSRDHQSIITVSSTDPWHRSVDIDRRIEQPGFDKVFQSRLTNELPVLMPVPLLYDTPENAAAEIRYLRLRGYKVRQLEMSEEPEGQFIGPEDYGALYSQWVKALRKVDANLQFGGPCFATLDANLDAPPEAPVTRTWMKLFLDYLRKRELLSTFSFFSFEWYPFDEVCEPTAPQLAEAPERLANALTLMRQAGLPPNIPIYITEYGYSAYATQAQLDLEGALMNADIVGQFLTLGGNRAYLYGYEPNEVIQEVPCTWGINALFLRGASGSIQYRLATYYGAQLLTREWAEPFDALHEIYRATSDIRNPKGQALVTAYAIRRPDGQLALMLINKDPQQSYAVQIKFQVADDNSTTHFQSPVDLYQFSSEQYLWHAAKEKGYPELSLPPKHTVIDLGKGQTVLLPPYSLSVVRGKV